MDLTAMERRMVPIRSFSDLTPEDAVCFRLERADVYHNIKYDGILNTGNMQNMYLAII